MTRFAGTLLLLLTACDRGSEAVVATGAGAAIEKSAIARGLVADPAAIDPTGVFASDTDRVCIVPDKDGYRIGASVDYGDGQSCVASGGAKGRSRLDVRFGDTCRLEARIEGDRITFPALIPAACDAFCNGRASLAALSANRLSHSAAEASSSVGPGGVSLCH